MQAQNLKSQNLKSQKLNFQFGQRKLQKVKYTYMLPIPVDWVKNMGVSKGDTLSIEMLEDNSLRIIPN